MLLRVKRGIFAEARSTSECYAGMVGKGAEGRDFFLEGRDAKHRIGMRGRMDVFDSTEMQRASGCGVLFGGASLGEKKSLGPKGRPCLLSRGSARRRRWAAPFRALL